jgi:hypothetical protein
MQLADFRQMVDRMIADIPPAYLEGIAEIEVSPRAVAHPEREAVYTMGEWIPIDVGGGEHSPSRIVLYYGSFAALARDERGFDWRGEAWETLTHELRHHLEAKANARDLEEYDWAAEEGFARIDDDAFDPVFYLSGERLDTDAYQVDESVFLDRKVQELPVSTEFVWKGRRYKVQVPQTSLPLFLTVTGVEHPPSGHLTLVFRRKPGMLDLFRGRARPSERDARAEPA